MGGERRQDRDLVDHEGELVRLDPDGPEIGGLLDLDRPDRLAELLVIDRGTGGHPHPTHHVEEPKARRIHADALDPERRTRERGRRHEEGR